MSSQVLNKQRNNTDSLYANGASLGNGGLVSLGAVTGNSINAASGELDLSNSQFVAPSTANASASVKLLNTGGGAIVGTPEVVLTINNTNPNLRAAAVTLTSYATTAADAPTPANSYGISRSGVASLPLITPVNSQGTFTTTGADVLVVVDGMTAASKVIVYGIVGTTNAGGLAAYVAAIAAPVIVINPAGFSASATIAGLIYSYQVLYA
jgi:hypothetical protein